MATTTPGQALCRLDDIPEGGAIAVDALLRDGEDSVIVLRRDDTVRAYLNVCPHAGRRLDWAPGQFLKSREGHLVCAVHGATFETAGGACIAGPCRGDALRAVAVKVRDGQVVLA